MKTRTLYIVLFLLSLTICFNACKDIMEPSLSKRTINARTPGDKYQSTSYGINFWWDEVEDAITYHLQVVTPNFTNPGALVLDTVIKSTTFLFNLKPGKYEWHVLAQNGSSQTAYSVPKSFTVLAGSITGQTVQLSSPANNFLTNQSSVLFQWGTLYGATKYHLEIDTNNFVDETKLVSDQSLPGQQLNFTFPKEQTYQWRVRAENDTAKAQWSGINVLTFDRTPPVQVVTVAPNNNQQISLPANLQWNTVNSAVKYKLYAFKADSTTAYSTNFPIVVNGNSYTFNTGNIGDKIYWKVTAIDAAGNEGTASLLKSFMLK